MGEYTLKVKIVDTTYNKEFITLHKEATVVFKDAWRCDEIKQFEESLNNIDSELGIIVDDDRGMITFKMPFEVGYYELLENDPKEVLNNCLYDFRDLVEPIFKAMVSDKVSNVFGHINNYHGSFKIEDEEE